MTLILVWYYDSLILKESQVGVEDGKLNLYRKSCVARHGVEEDEPGHFLFCMVRLPFVDPALLLVSASLIFFFFNIKLYNKIGILRNSYCTIKIILSKY